MPLPVIANTYRCSFHWVGTMSAHEVISVQHFRTTESAEDLAADLDGNATVGMFGYTESTVAATEVDIILLDGTSASQTFPLDNWQSSGGAGETIPGFNVMVLGSTGLRGPANRGRLFLPSPGENVVTDGLLDAGNATAMTTAWEAYKDALLASFVEYGVASYVTPDFDPYISMFVPRKLGIIRRRRRIA